MAEIEKKTSISGQNAPAEEAEALDIPMEKAAKKPTAVKKSAVEPAKKTASKAGTSPAKAKSAASGKPAAATGKKKQAGGAKKKAADVKAIGLTALNAAKKLGRKLSVAAKEAAKSIAKKREKPARKPLSKKAALRRKKRIRRIIRRSILSVVTVLLVAVLGVYMVLFTVFHGPSQTASDLLVNTVTETSALKFVPYLFFSEQEVQDILARNAVKVPDEPTDTSMIVIDRTPKTETVDGTGEQEKDIELVEVNGPTYHGYMMIVKDPSRVSLATCCDDFDSEYGKYINEMADEAGAIAAINAGGFSDENGGGRGGKPLGVVVKDGKILNRKYDRECDTLIGFDQDDKLIVGLLNADDAERLGIRDAASFNPVLVLNGEPAEITGSSSGLNPRTAIGQRADGAVLLLVIDGRQVNSLGASLADLIDVMMQFGAVNAANLDGGSSSKMYYNGEFVNEGVALTGSRRLPTAFIVK